jgi:hypothetical protein
MENQVNRKALAVAVEGLFRFGVAPSFNLEAFAQGSFEGKNDTRYLRVEPKEYNAVIVGPFGQEKATRLRVEKDFLILDVVWELSDEEQRQKLGVEKMPTIRQSIFLDTTPSGALDMGPFKNGALGRLREAIGLNQDGQPWSFAQFIGRPARVKVEHKPNEKDPQNPYQNVTAVTKL